MTTEQHGPVSWSPGSVSGRGLAQRLEGAESATGDEDRQRFRRWITRPVVVIDTETTGLDERAQVWEVAAVRLDADGSRREVSVFVEHDESAAEQLPESYRADHAARYDASTALDVHALSGLLSELFATDDDGRRPLFVGACPQFDERVLADACGPHVRTLWSHRLRCVEAMTVGRLGFDPGGLASCLEALHLPGNDAPHTALGDARAAAAIWQHLTRSAPVPAA